MRKYSVRILSHHNRYLDFKYEAIDKKIGENIWPTRQKILATSRLPFGSQKVYKNLIRKIRQKFSRLPFGAQVLSIKY